jgi:hypothetical protein
MAAIRVKAERTSDVVGANVGRDEAYMLLYICNDTSIDQSPSFNPRSSDHIPLSQSILSRPASAIALTVQQQWQHENQMSTRGKATTANFFL